MRSPRRRLFVIVGFALLTSRARGAATAPALRSAASFAILGGSAVTSSGAPFIIGNVGVSPGSTIAGITPADVSIGRIDANDASAKQAQKDSATAYDELAARSCDVDVPGVSAGQDPLAPGVYCFDGDALLSGAVTLDAGGSRDAVWIFRVRGALTADPRSSVVVLHGGSDANVFWQVGRSATLGEDSSFRGTILALTDIALRNGASLSGRALAQRGTVTLHGNDVSLCCAPIAVTPAALPDAVAGSAFRQTLAASGGTESFTFGMAGAPEWLRLNGDVLSGIAEAGSFAFTVTATDAITKCSGSRAYRVNVCAPIVLSPAALHGARVGKFYDHAFTASGGTPHYTYTIDPPAPIGGLTFDGDTGRLSGLPLAAGTVSFTVTARDAYGCMGSRHYDIQVTIPPPAASGVPALSLWAMLMLAACLATAAVAVLGRLP